MKKDPGDEPRFGYEIYSEKLGRPMGLRTHIAKLSRMADRHLNIDVAGPLIKGAWGETASDAKEKMTAIVEAWIAEQR